MKHNEYIEDSFELEELKNRFKRLKLMKMQKRMNRKSRLILALTGVILSTAVACTIYWAAEYHLEMRAIALMNEKTLTAITARESGNGGAEGQKISNLRAAFSNEEIVGYLEIYGTNIAYAVAQAADNEFYSNRDLYGKKNASGSIFMDFECNAYELSRNTIIYGNNMRDGSMFHNLRYFSNEKYLLEHPYISLITAHGETLWEIFAVYKASENVNYIQVLFPDDKSFEELVSAMQENSLHSPDSDITDENLTSKILTLVSFDGTPGSDSYVINAKLITPAVENAAGSLFNSRSIIPRHLKTAMHKPVQFCLQ